MLSKRKIEKIGGRYFLNMKSKSYEIKNSFIIKKLGDKGFRKWVMTHKSPIEVLVAFESAIVNRSIVELPLNNLNRDMFPFGCLPAGMDWAILGDEYWWIGPKGIMGSIMMLSEGESSRCHLSEIKTFLDGLSFLPKKLIKMVEKDSGLSVDDMREIIDCKLPITKGLVVKKGRGFKKDERNLYNSVKEWAKGLKLSISERGALIEYIENGDYINEILRNDSRVSSFGLGYIPWYVRKIDGVMGRSFCPRDMTLERGISRSFFNKLIEIGEGGIWRDSGYVSTAFDNSHEEFGDYFLKISVSRGTGAIPVGQFSFGDEKDEILLARGLKFKNIKLEYNTLYVKVVG